jgi:hypothetical protein
VSNSIAGMLAQPIWDGLEAKSWDADQLKQLQTLLSRQDALTCYVKATLSEAVGCARTIDYLEKHRGDSDMLEFVTMQGDHFGPSSLERPLQRIFRIAPKGWYDQNKSRIVNHYQKYYLGAVDPAAHRVFPSIIAAGTAEQDATRAGPYTLFYQMGSTVFEQTLVEATRAQVTCDQAEIACALERYFLDHQSYPSDLAALTPAYMAATPTDVIDGAPMRYQRTADGRYRLYSIGWNARDDGGQVAWRRGPHLDNRQGDWVWQYQAIKPPEFRQN